jgi:phosphate transport system substrate-binding protein
MKKTLIIVLLVVLLINMIGCGAFFQKQVTTIRIKGSDTMYILAELWAAQYMRANPGISIYVEGGGTATGFQALVNKEADIVMASRLIRGDEAEGLAYAYRSIGMLYLVAKDALSIYVNYHNPVEELTLYEVRKIFSGEIKNWNEVGGKNDTIQVFIRPPNSGTNSYFKKFVLGRDEYTKSAKVLSSTPAIVDQVTENPNAIGYGGLAYGPSVKHLRIEGEEPIEENVRQDSYPLSRYLYLYTANTPTGAVKSFIDWILSPAGQRVVERVGYISIWPVPKE